MKNKQFTIEYALQLSKALKLPDVKIEWCNWGKSNFATAFNKENKRNKSGKYLIRFYQPVLKNLTPIQIANIVSHELAHIIQFEEQALNFSIRANCCDQKHRIKRLLGHSAMINLSEEEAEAFAAYSINYVFDFDKKPSLATKRKLKHLFPNVRLFLKRKKISLKKVALQLQTAYF